MFCPLCGSLLLPNDEKMKCCCGYEGDKIKIKDKVEEKMQVGVLQEEINVDGTSRIDCPNCNSKEAYSWLVQTLPSDEPETMFFKCIKCKHQWRQYK